MLQGFTKPQRFADTDWSAIANEPGAYVIFDLEETVYVGMAGRKGNGGLRNRLRDHSTGQIVNMFAQYLFLARVTHPRETKVAYRDYIAERCSFCFTTAGSALQARELEDELERSLTPTLNP